MLGLPTLWATNYRQLEGRLPLRRTAAGFAAAEKSA